MAHPFGRVKARTEVASHITSLVKNEESKLTCAWLFALNQLSVLPRPLPRE